MTKNMTVEQGPLKIGLSPRFLHSVPPALGFRGKTLQYLEQSIAHWLMAVDALVFMIPSVASGGLLRRGNIHVADYVMALDGLVLQGGTDVSPLTYGEQPVKAAWEGDRVRDVYEIDLVRQFVAAGKPVLGICRGLQLINVAFGGSLYQDIPDQFANPIAHYHADDYDQHFHSITFVEGSGLAACYPGLKESRVNSLHHQAVRKLGQDLTVEALSLPDEIIEAIRWRGASYVLGVQWHPEFHDPTDPRLLSGEPLLREFLDAARERRTLI